VSPFLSLILDGRQLIVFETDKVPTWYWHPRRGGFALRAVSVLDRRGPWQDEAVSACPVGFEDRHRIRRGIIYAQG
jgi:hypothetical protein